MHPTEHRQEAPGWLVWAALLTVYVVWGSTYLAIALVVETMPALLAAGVRFVIAGLLIGGILAIVRGPRQLRIGRRELLGSAFVGVMLLLLGNGMVMLAQVTVPSGLAALVIAVVPLWVVVIRAFFGERVGRGTMAGVLVGFAGVAVMVGRGVTGEVDVFGLALLIFAAGSWSVGSYYSRRIALPRDPFVSSAAQMLLGGIALLIVGSALGEWAAFRADHFSLASVGGLLYLIIFGSIVTYSAYTWLLQNAPVSKVATYAYVNPVVAIFLGWLVLREEFSLSMAIGGAMIVAAVAVVIRSESRPQRTGALEAAPAQAGGLRGMRRLRPKDTVATQQTVDAAGGGE